MKEGEGTSGRRYRGMAIEERKAMRRQQLLEAGLQVFGDVGFHGATVRLICAQAGLTERYFYESFTNSEDLLCAVYQQHMQLQQARILDAVMQTSRSPEAMIEAGLRAFFKLAQEIPAGARVQFVEVLGVSPRVDNLYRQSVENFATLMRTLNREILPASIVLGGDEETLSIGLVGAAVGIASRWLLSGFAQSLESILKTTLLIFIGVSQQRQVSEAH
jgi:AcrR family transcriptional regulator